MFINIKNACIIIKYLKVKQSFTKIISRES